LFDALRGEGFIKREDTGEDIYVHHLSIAKVKGKRGNKATLAVGESVKFNVIKSERGVEACNVRGPNGATVMGSSLAEFKEENNNRASEAPPVKPLSNMGYVRTHSLRDLTLNHVNDCNSGSWESGPPLLKKGDFKKKRSRGKNKNQKTSVKKGKYV